MNKLSEEKIASQTIFRGKILEVRLDRVLLPNGNEAPREVVSHPGAVAVVPVTADGKIVMVRQYRYPVGELLLEIPAGKLDKGERPEACALRELEEETGFKAGTLKKLTSTYSTPGFSDEILHIFLAENLAQAQQRLDNDEFVAVEVYDREALRKMITANEIKDAKTLVGLLMAGC